VPKNVFIDKFRYHQNNLSGYLNCTLNHFLRKYFEPVPKAHLLKSKLLIIEKTL